MRFEDLTMNNLKTRDLPIMMRIASKLELNSFVEGLVDIYYNEEVPDELLKELESMNEEDKTKAIKKYRNEKGVEQMTVLLERIVAGYDSVHPDVEVLIASVYGLKAEEVANLDLDVTLKCIYNLKEQEQLINFFKTALK